MGTQRASSGSGHTRGDRHETLETHQGAVEELKQDADEAKKFGIRAYQKFANDWTMNLTAMVSYNLLTSFFPLVLALITILALLPAVSNNTSQFAAQINSILPSDVSRNIKIDSLLKSVHKAEGILGLVSIVGLLWGGTNLFGSIENAFAVIFRVKTRSFVKQKLMALVMILLFVVLLPLSFVSSLLLGSTTTSLGRIMPSGLSGPASLVVGLAAGLASLFILFLAIYVVVPNMPISWRHAWRGALAAAVVMWIINTAFPFYTAHFVGTKNYGAAAIGSAIITITWFWFFSLVLL
ncbi:MAG: YihY/virulence factor BrkB family protein, partial [Chloroflexota bacterium]